MDYAAWLHTGLARMVGQQFCSVFPYTAEVLGKKKDVRIFKNMFIFVTLIKYFYRHSVKEDAMVRLCSMHGKDERLM
jgi:hypothetical protein